MEFLNQADPCVVVRNANDYAVASNGDATSEVVQRSNIYNGD